MCDRNLIGDEYHYLFECENFKEIRSFYLPKYYIVHHNTYKFTKLMTRTNIRLLQRLSEFISNILSRFK